MAELAKATEARRYFNNIIKELGDVKIKMIFSNCPTCGNVDGFRRYEEDTPIYILFENRQCLIIDYRFVDALRVEFRPLNEEENSIFERQPIKDYFNCTTEIHSWTKNEVGEVVVGGVCHTEIISLEYDSLISVAIRPVTTQYSKWTRDGLDYAIPTAKTFDEIRFTMKNGNSFAVCPEDADMDGYIMVWSVDAKEIICKGDQNGEH